MFLAFWVHHINPFLGPHWGHIGIRYYGLSYVLGFLAAAGLLRLYCRAGRSQLPAARVPDLMVAVVLGTLIGGRLGYFLLYHPASLAGDPLAILRVWEGGMASHGGILGIVIFTFWYARRHKISWMGLGDNLVVAAPLHTV